MLAVTGRQASRAFQELGDRCQTGSDEMSEHAGNKYGQVLCPSWCESTHMDDLIDPAGGVSHDRTIATFDLPEIEDLRDDHPGPMTVAIERYVTAEREHPLLVSLWKAFKENLTLTPAEARVLAAALITGADQADAIDGGGAVGRPEGR